MVDEYINEQLTHFLKECYGIVPTQPINWKDCGSDAICVHYGDKFTDTQIIYDWEFVRFLVDKVYFWKNKYEEVQENNFG